MIYKIYTFQYETNQFLYGLGKGHQQYFKIYPKYNTLLVLCDFNSFTVTLFVYLYNYMIYRLKVKQKDQTALQETVLTRITIVIFQIVTPYFKLMLVMQNPLSAICRPDKLYVKKCFWFSFLLMKLTNRLIRYHAHTLSSFYDL